MDAVRISSLASLVRAVLPVALLTYMLPAAGCPAGNGADDAWRGDKARPRESGGDVQPLKSVDFVVQGCARWQDEHCEGMAPLRLTFVAVTAGIESLGQWDFGDGSPPVNGSVVSHDYEEPGTYDVTLVIGIAGGTLSEQKPGLVVVQPAGPGSRCNQDESCVGKTCVCAAGCDYPLHDGLCLIECEKMSCPADSACVDLAVGSGAVAEPWRTNLCLSGCTSDEQCARASFACRLAPSSTGWRRVCLPSTLRSIGEPCRGADGKPDHALCLGGLCLDFGSGGYCSASCSAGTCPQGTRCAKLVDEPLPVCLRRCGPGSCSGDPQLGCESPQAEGAYGFEILGPVDPAQTMYCSVKRCSKASDCGLAGTCDVDAGGFCRPLSFAP